MLDANEGRDLLRIARISIETAFQDDKNLPTATSTAPALLESRASFVTLKCSGTLRGCIGTLEAVKPLIEDVAHNARAAAFHDPRFSPLRSAELPELRIEISVLEKPIEFEAKNRQELCQRLRPGKDGLIVKTDTRRATFLPSVWESLSDPEIFVAHLWQKAGLVPECWPADLRLWRYSAEHFTEARSSAQSAD